MNTAAEGGEDASDDRRQLLRSDSSGPQLSGMKAHIFASLFMRIAARYLNHSRPVSIGSHSEETCHHERNLCFRVSEDTPLLVPFHKQNGPQNRSVQSLLKNTNHGLSPANLHTLCRYDNRCPHSLRSLPERLSVPCSKTIS